MTGAASGIGRVPALDLTGLSSIPVILYVREERVGDLPAMKATKKGNSMRRMLYLATLSIVATLLVAPAALGQGAGPGGEGPCTGTPFEQYIPEVNGCVTTEGLPDPGATIVYDADTREPIGTLAEVTANLENETPTTTGDQYPTNTQVQYEPTLADEPVPTESLPDTGGLGGATLLLPAAGLLLATGLIGLRVLRRR